MNEPVRSLRIDRLVLRGASLDAHDLARLPQLIGAELQRRADPAPSKASDVTDVHRLAAEVARRTSAAVSEEGEPR